MGKVVSGVLGGGDDSAKDAAKISAQSAREANAISQKQYDQNRADTQVFREAGQNATNKLSDLLGLTSGGSGDLLKNFTLDDMNNDPVYQSGLKFGLDQGIQGLNRQAAAGGSLNSGATLKALTRYANDYGSTKANDSYNRFMNNKSTLYNMLAGQQGAGINAVGATMGANTGISSQMGQNLVNAGDTAANAAVAQGAMRNNLLNTALGAGLKWWLG